MVVIWKNTTIFWVNSCGYVSIVQKRFFLTRLNVHLFSRQESNEMRELRIPHNPLNAANIDTPWLSYTPRRVLHGLNQLISS